MKKQEIRVLVVEDNPGDFALTNRMLRAIEAADLSVVHASTLAAALSEVVQPIDIILLDLNLPDSAELATLRQMRKQARSIPILVLTGIEDRQKAVEALAEGAADYLVKGKVDHRLLERAILRHLPLAANAGRPAEEFPRK